MHRHTSQRGAALILLLGITAALAILSSTLVFVLVNEQRATARGARTQSFYAAEGALDSAVQMAKVNTTMSTTAEWLTGGGSPGRLQRRVPGRRDRGLQGVRQPRDRG